VENEHVELLLQSLSYLYDQLIINITYDNITDTLHFGDVALQFLEKNLGIRIRKKCQRVQSKGFDDDERQINRMWPKWESKSW